jgi:dTDP-4-dehydrorhamnose reductase
MRLLIAGWQGQVARAFVEAVPGCADITACAVGRPALDVCDPKSIERAMGDLRPDVVINTAAYTEVDKAESEPERAFALNSDGARLLAQSAARRGAAIIHLSTDYVFDGDKDTPYIESDMPGPRTVYGLSKLAGEEAVRAANPRHVILRTAWVFSPMGRNFVRNTLRLAGEQDRLRIVGDRHGSPTYAPHLVTAILELARQLKAVAEGDGRWGIYHAAGAGSTTWYGLACEIMRRSEELGGPAAPVDPIPSSEYATAAPRPANSRLDCAKLEAAFGVKLPAWESGVAECVQRLLAARDTSAGQA